MENLSILKITRNNYTSMIANSAGTCQKGGPGHTCSCSGGCVSCRK